MRFVRGDSPLKSGFGQVAGAIGLVFAWMAFWYWETANQVASIWWRSDTFAHGLAVVGPSLSGWYGVPEGALMDCNRVR
ncbi:hypothetical protein [Thauera humireducens]|uniref:hypothetical protein n=1 Tax=Thauera humireducens TaxID=1134435 RepID=UPI00311DDA71